MIPFRRLWRRVQAPAVPVVSRELAASLGVALAAADRGEVEDLGSFEQGADGPGWTESVLGAALSRAGHLVAGGASNSGAIALAANEMSNPEPVAKPKPEQAVHYLLDRQDRLACGAALGLATYVATNTAAVTCGACKRTRIYKTRTSPDAIPAAGTTRKQES